MHAVYECNEKNVWKCRHIEMASEKEWKSQRKRDKNVTYWVNPIWTTKEYVKFNKRQFSTFFSAVCFTGLPPLKSVFEMSAPAPSRARNASISPHTVAQWTTECPSLSTASTFALFAINKFTSAIFPWMTAKWSGVKPSSSADSSNSGAAVVTLAAATKSNWPQQ